MHPRAHRRLGHDQKLRFFEKLADFRRDGHELIAAAQEPRLGRPQQAEPGFELRLERVFAVGEGVVAGAKERKIVGRDPLQELNRFGDLVGRQRRRIGLQFGGHFAGARQHRPPILDRDAHVGEDAFEVTDDLGALRLVLQAGDMNVNEAFAVTFALARPLECREPAGLVALDGEDRVHHQPQIEPAFAQFAEHRIDQERHVVVEDVEHRDTRRRSQRHQRDLRRARRALQQKRPGLFGDAGKLRRAIALEILRRGAAEKLDQKIPGDVAPARGENGGRRADKALAGFVVFGTGNVLDRHGLPSRFSRFAEALSPILGGRGHYPLRSAPP